MCASIREEAFLVNVLFVCLGNICRSPSAEGVFRALVEREELSAHITTDSAGTAAYHVGQPPDPRAQAAARSRGIDLSDFRARQAKPDDFDTFDYVIAMDHDNQGALLEVCPFGQEGRIHMFLKFAPGRHQAEVPDPFYGDAGFEVVLDMLESAAEGLLDHIREHDLT